MRKFKFTSVSFLLASFVLSSCGPTKYEEIRFDPDTSVTKIDINEIVLDALLVCKKDDSTQNLSQINVADIFTLQDEIASQAYEVKDCKGKTTKVGVGPVREFNHVIEVKQTAGLSEKLNFIEIGNDRTCHTLRVKIGSGVQFSSELLPEGSAIDHLITRANSNGDLKILLRDIPLRVGPGLAVADGTNILTIKYFGECLEKKGNLVENADDSVNCLKAKEIAAKQIALSIKIERPQIAGTREVIDCPMQ